MTSLTTIPNSEQPERGKPRLFLNSSPQSKGINHAQIPMRDLKIKSR